ncbi:MAG TPA: DUF1801 domain-containing protein [Blastocatellia bacterium]|nr:DUF1801 domain-containing protein [Blastocatellia bacterium]
MKTDRQPPKDIDEYIAQCSPEVRPILERIRATVRKAAPKAKERISYRMPAFSLDGDIVYFAAFKQHIGLFPPVPRGDAQLIKDASVYSGPKGNLRFPLDQRIPYGLISRIVKAQVQENLKRSEARRATKKRRSAVKGSSVSKLAKTR